MKARLDDSRSRNSSVLFFQEPPLTHHWSSPARLDLPQATATSLPHLKPASLVPEAILNTW